jgi:hypothetical protein
MLAEKNNNPSSGKNITYLQIRDNSLVKTSKEQEDSSWKKQIVFNPNDKEQKTPIVKYYKYFNSVRGVITNAFWYQNDPFKGYKINLTEGEETYQVDISLNSYKVMDKFLTTFGNIDLDKPLKIVAWGAPVKDKEGNPKLDTEGKQKIETAFVFYQENPKTGKEETVKRVFTQDTPVPKEFQPKKGKTGWDFKAYTEYLCSLVDEVIEARFPQNKEEPQDTEVDSEVDDEKVPF